MRSPQALDSPAPFRYGAFAMFEGRNTLAQAAQEVLGSAEIPFFDIGNSDAVFSFGANFLSTFLSPVAYGRGYSGLRKGKTTGKRGILVHFEPRLSQTASNADHWVPVLPGTEGLAALGLGKAAAELTGVAMPAMYQSIDMAKIAQSTGVSQETYRLLAGLFAGAAHPLAIPGEAALAASNGVDAGQAILALNVLAGNLGNPGGVFLTPSTPIQLVGKALASVPNTFQDIAGLVDAMKSGKIKTLFIHGVNPFYEFPTSLGFADAAKKVSKIISFASFPDETALQADYVFPDHTGLESWGYQRILTGGDRPVISGAQPVVVPFYNTKATADVFLAAVKAAGRKVAQVVPYNDVVAFIQNTVQTVLNVDGYYNAPELPTFWAEWQQYGGWWTAAAGLTAPTASGNAGQEIQAAEPQYEGDGEYYLYPFMNGPLSDGSGANKPWLQETPDPTTTVMWNTWVEIHPDTADKLGLKDDDVVRVTSPFGEIEASVYRYPAIRPDTIGIPFGQGHTAFGRYAQDRGANLAALFGQKVNSSGDLAVHAVKVKLTKTGKTFFLARLESRMGVYGHYQV